MRAECRHTAPCPWEGALQSSQSSNFLLLSKLPPALQFSVSYLKSSPRSRGCRGVVRGGLMDLSPMGVGDKNKSAWSWALKRLNGTCSTLTHKGLVQFLVTQCPVIISNFSFCSEVCSGRLFVPCSLMLQLPAFSFCQHSWLLGWAVNSVRDRTWIKSVKEKWVTSLHSAGLSGSLTDGWVSSCGGGGRRN